MTKPKITEPPMPEDAKALFEMGQKLLENDYDTLTHTHFHDVVSEYIQSKNYTDSMEKAKKYNEYMKLFKSFLDFLVNNGKLFRNPLESFSVDVNIESIIKSHLIKKAFTETEELEIYNELCSDQYVNHMSFGMALMFFTGMSAQEVCALRFSDIRRIAVLMSTHPEGMFEIPREDEEYIITVSRVYRELNGKYQVTDFVKSRSVFRILPISKMCKSAIRHRCNYLLSIGYDIDKIALMPMVCQTNSLLSKECPPETLTRYIKDMLSSKNIQQTDLLLPCINSRRYRNRNEARKEKPEKRVLTLNINNKLLRTNFEYRARYRCQLTESEISYLLGKTCGDVTSRHYREFREMFNQYALLQKLNRWCINPLSECSNSASHPYGIVEKKTPNNITLRIYPQENSNISAVYVDIAGELGKPINIELSCLKGMNGSITINTEPNEYEKSKTE